mgnify:CR=1 FL=1|jgi:hypothetical protein
MLSATTTTNRQIQFSNYTWNVRINNTVQQDPGPNYYTDSSQNVYVDSNGYLHMKITKVNNKWYSS